MTSSPTRKSRLPLSSDAYRQGYGPQMLVTNRRSAFLRSFTFGHVRQLDRLIAVSIRRASKLSVGLVPTP